MLTLQKKVEKYFIEKEKKFPYTWNVLLDENNKNYFLEGNKKRYCMIQSCIYCERKFGVRLNQKDVKYCSKYCASIDNSKQIDINCSFCKKSFKRTENKIYLKFNFCSRLCKDNAQRIDDGLENFKPSHYKKNGVKYVERALRKYGCKCFDCNETNKFLLTVHHIDGNKSNNKIENLEVLCSNHHLVRHLRFDSELKEWIFSTKELTPREKIPEILKLLSK